MQKFQIAIQKWGKESPEKLNQIAREKSFSKNHLSIWKIPINGADHFKNGLGAIAMLMEFSNIQTVALEIK